MMPIRKPRRIPSVVGIRAKRLTELVELYGTLREYRFAALTNIEREKVIHRTETVMHEVQRRERLRLYG